jgi:hypothetical protein
VTFAEGQKVTVFVLGESFDLLAASESSLSFWDNTLDDDDRNDA